MDQPQGFTQEDYEELSRARQQNEGDLILLVQDLWSVISNSVDTDAPCEAEDFRSFMLPALALL